VRLHRFEGPDGLSKGQRGLQAVRDQRIERAAPVGDDLRVRALSSFRERAITFPLRRRVRKPE